MAVVQNTRIKLKYDTYENWESSELILQPGEIAICYIPQGTIWNDGSEIKEATIMYKVGDGSQRAFHFLPWGSITAFNDKYSRDIITTYATKAELQKVDEEYVIVKDIDARNQIESPRTGMMVYVEDKNCIYFYSKSQNWCLLYTSTDETLLSLFDPQYFKIGSNSLLTLKVDDKVTPKSKNLITSGAVAQHVEDTVGVIECKLESI